MASRMTLPRRASRQDHSGWLRRHAESLESVASHAEPILDACDGDADAAYVAALSALFNWVDSEASTAGLKGSGAALEEARRKLDELETGFLDAQDREAPRGRDASTRVACGGRCLDTRRGKTVQNERRLPRRASRKRILAGNANFVSDMLKKEAGAAAEADRKMSAAAAYLAAKKKGAG